MTRQPTADELLDRLHVVALPLRVRFRGILTREVALVEGPAGWAEFGPFPEYDDAEAAVWLRCAVEMGWQGPPAAVRDRVPVNATCPAVRPDEVAGVLESFPGCGTVKVKVAERGQDLDDDLARVSAVLDARPGARIRVDANGGWTVEAAERAGRALDALVTGRTGRGLEYLEQPCASVPELVALRGRLAGPPVGGGVAGSVPVAADESIRRAEDPLRVVRAGGADRAVVKAAPLGGPRRLVRLAGELGIPVTVSSALDSAVGMAAGVAAAAALPGSPEYPDGVPAAGLGTGGLLAEDVVDRSRGWVLTGGALRPGPAPVPDPARLAGLAAPTDRIRWWRERVRRCHTLV